MKRAEELANRSEELNRQLLRLAEALTRPTMIRPREVPKEPSKPGDTPGTGQQQDEEQRGAGVVRVAVTESQDIFPNVAFMTPDGKIVLIVVNDSYVANSFRIQYKGQYAIARLSPGAAGTYVFNRSVNE